MNMKPIAVFLAAFLIAGGAVAQSYPSKPITLVAPFAIGSTVDILSRTVGAELAKRLGQPVIVDNRPGAGGTIAMQQVARAAPDGYTLALVSNGTLAINIDLYSKPGYDPVKDFTPITLIGEVSNIMIVHPSNPATNAQDVIAQAKAKPGELTFSSGGNGTSHHLSGIVFASMAGIDIVHVPYKGAPQGITAVMSKEVTMGFFNTPTVISQIRNGRVKALAVTSKTRTPYFPAVPTLDESGLKGYEVTAWFGFGGPAGLPAPVLERLYGEIARIMKDPAVREKLNNLGVELLPQIPPAEFGKLIQSELAKWGPIVKASGAKVD
jgi:tripartite-type tricarboxylate transporter receptor subunit TctC